MHRQFQFSVTNRSTYCQERTWNRYLTQIRVLDKKVREKVSQIEVKTVQNPGGVIR